MLSRISSKLAFPSVLPRWKQWEWPPFSSAGETQPAGLKETNNAFLCCVVPFFRDFVGDVQEKTISDSTKKTATWYNEFSLNRKLDGFFFWGVSRYLHHHIHGLKTSSRSNLCVLSALAICVYGAVIGLGNVTFPRPRNQQCFPKCQGLPPGRPGG